MTTHYEHATELLEAHASAMDRDKRNTQYEDTLLSVALIHAVLDLSTQLSLLVGDHGIVYTRNANAV